MALPYSNFTRSERPAASARPVASSSWTLLTLTPVAFAPVVSAIWTVGAPAPQPRSRKWSVGFSLSASMQYSTTRVCALFDRS
jgi:hypothetical protein